MAATIDTAVLPAAARSAPPRVEAIPFTPCAALRGHHAVEWNDRARTRRPPCAGAAMRAHLADDASEFSA